MASTHENPSAPPEQSLNICVETPHHSANPVADTVIAVSAVDETHPEGQGEALRLGVRVTDPVSDCGVTEGEAVAVVDV